MKSFFLVTLLAGPGLASPFAGKPKWGSASVTSVPTPIGKDWKRPDGEHSPIFHWPPVSTPVPSVTTPVVSTPSVSAPSVSIPSVSTPSVSTPPVVSSASSEISSVTSSAPPVLRTCELGTAFGWQSVEESTTLNTQPGNGCNRWGWYQTPSLEELQDGISGILYVGAGGNNRDNADIVGRWTAIASSTGGVIVTYSLDPGYFIDEAHIDLDCLPIDTCAPGQYTFNSGALPNLPGYQNPTPIQYPECDTGIGAYLIIHGSINVITTAATCDRPVDT